MDACVCTLVVAQINLFDVDHAVVHCGVCVSRVIREIAGTKVQSHIDSATSQA